MHDGITFDPTGRMIAKTLGMSDFRYALVDHPIGSAGIEGLQARALDAYEQGRSILLGL